jgi:hypothetical protein
MRLWIDALAARQAAKRERFLGLLLVCGWVSCPLPPVWPAPMGITSVKGAPPSAWVRGWGDPPRFWVRGWVLGRILWAEPP